jgi:hypothetical protein
LIFVYIGLLINQEGLSFVDWVVMQCTFLA